MHIICKILLFVCSFVLKYTASVYLITVNDIMNNIKYTFKVLKHVSQKYHIPLIHSEQ